MPRIILDLCGGTGSWSKPYKEAGYDVRLVTLPEHDVRTFRPPPDVYGILAAPPCTHFSLSGAKHWKTKDADGRTFQDATILTAVLMIIARTMLPRFWVIENPVGRMRNLLGDPDFKFNPCDFGDPYTKKTYLWGNFNPPAKTPVEPTLGSLMHTKYGGSSARTKEARSITPPGFSRAFFEANP